MIWQKHQLDAHRMGQIMTQTVAGNRRLSPRVTNALVFAGVLLMAPAVLCGGVSAQALGYASAPQSAFPSDDIMLAPNQPGLTDQGSGSVVPERLRRNHRVSRYPRSRRHRHHRYAANRALSTCSASGRAMRYGIGVGREGFTWSGVQQISRKAEWPDWNPPPEMIARQPYLPRFVAGGPGNPLGARAMYLGGTQYRIHGTNDPSTIGKQVSSGCIRLTNDNVTDLYARVGVGTKVVVLPKNSPHPEARGLEAKGTITVRPTAAQPRPVVTRVSTGRQAMNLSTSSLY